MAAARPDGAVIVLAGCSAPRLAADRVLRSVTAGLAAAPAPVRRHWLLVPLERLVTQALVGPCGAVLQQVVALCRGTSSSVTRLTCLS